MQGKQNVSANTVSTTDPEEPKRTEVLHSFKVLNTLKRSGAESVIKILFPGVFSKAQSVEDFWQVYSSYTCWRPYA